LASRLASPPSWVYQGRKGRERGRGRVGKGKKGSKMEEGRHEKEKAGIRKGKKKRVGKGKWEA